MYVRACVCAWLCFLDTGPKYEAPFVSVNHVHDLTSRRWFLPRLVSPSYGGCIIDGKLVNEISLEHDVFSTEAHPPEKAPITLSVNQSSLHIEVTAQLVGIY